MKTEIIHIKQPELELSRVDTARARKIQQSKNLKKLIKPSGKTILPTGYKPELVRAIGHIEGFEPKTATSVTQRKIEILHINPRQTVVFIDYNCQRELTGQSLSVLTEISERFDFLKFKAPTLLKPPGNKLFCTDGQKSLYAAWYNNVAVPCLIVHCSAEEFMQAQAESFIAINTTQSRPTIADLFPALIMRGEGAESDIAALLKKHKINPVHNNGGQVGRFSAPRDTIALNTFREIHKQHGKDVLEWVCKVASQVGYRPIRAAHLRALAILYFRINPAKTDLDRLWNAINSIVDKYAFMEAKEAVYKSPKKTTIPTELANIYFQRYKKGSRALQNS